MINVKEIIGKVWYLGNAIDDAKVFCCFEAENCLMVIENGEHYECVFELSNDVIIINESEKTKLNGEYSLEKQGESLIITGESQSLLTGEWNATTVEELPPLECYDSEMQDMGTDYSNWMSSIDSSRALKDMCIPGTHDSAAY